MDVSDRKTRRQKPVIFTVGHSTHPIDEFTQMLKAHGIEAVAGVKTIPKSRHHPQFNADELQQALDSSGIRYLKGQLTYPGPAL